MAHTLAHRIAIAPVPGNSASLSALFYTDLAGLVDGRRRAAPGCLLRQRRDSKDGDRASPGCQGAFIQEAPPADSPGARGGGRPSLPACYLAR